MFLNHRGQILIELLLVVAITAVIAGLAAQMIGVSLRSVQISGRETIAKNLAEEMMETVRAVSGEKWHNIYLLNKSQTNTYYPVHQTTPVDKWVLQAGQENVIIGGVTYTRYLYFENAYRDEITEKITPSGTGTYEDPSTQKMTAIVTWNEGSITLNDYFSRWPNETAIQSAWFGAIGVAGPVTNFGYDFFTDDANLDYNTPPWSITLRREQ